MFFWLLLLQHFASYTQINSNELIISIKLFDQYYFQNSLDNEKEFVFQLMFKNDNLKLIPISLDINLEKFALKAKEFILRDEMVNYYQDKTTFQDYKELINIDKNNEIAIEKITMKEGLSLNSVVLEIKIKSGYYFIGYPVSQLSLSININNLLFKNDPSYDQIFTKVKIKFKGNEFLDKAKVFTTLNQLLNYFYNNDNWKNFFELSTNKKTNEYPILRLNVYQINEHKLLIKLQLKEGYYFENQHYTNLEKEIIVGNVYYKNQAIPKLTDIDISFNSKKFYELTKNLENKTWNGLIELISPELMNFNDSYNGILWTNTKNQSIYKVMDIKLQNNELVIILELDNGYYFDKDDQSNSRIELNYSHEKLKNLYQSGINQINSETNKRNLIIGLSVSLPFVGLAIVAITYFIKSKRKSKREELGEI